MPSPFLFIGISITYSTLRYYENCVKYREKEDCPAVLFSLSFLPDFLTYLRPRCLFPNLPPSFEYPVHIIRVCSRAEFALGDAAAVLPQRFIYQIHRIVYLLAASVGKQMLSVHFSPEGDFPPVRRQIFHTHTEQLAVHRIQPQIDEPGKDAQDMTVGVHENFLPVTVCDLDVIPVHGHEKFMEVFKKNYI